MIKKPSKNERQTQTQLPSFEKTFSKKGNSKILNTCLVYLIGITKEIANKKVSN